MQERALTTMLNGVHDGSLPATVSLYGPRGPARRGNPMVGFHAVHGVEAVNPDHR